eukprot:CAMPEP_0116838848 /NCGR_PEP_ID=MMETSP0418-20121206/9442_1 /TAXON_ID=1158023 /ORGANISM="Astrosyne radiata, Strain 13vi08-1A" /LENGTH=170 /DNA_ID=CAMNT_0004468899 /DNA_START=71 /DNA_END=586 /DNA_ORIENTATION=+
MALTYHQKASIDGGYCNTLQGTRHLYKALRLYSMSLALIRTVLTRGNNGIICPCVDSQGPPCDSCCRSGLPLLNSHYTLMVGLINNMGQIQYELGNHMKASHHFQQALKLWLLNDSSGMTPRNRKSRTTENAFSVADDTLFSDVSHDEMTTGILFNTMILVQTPKMASAA